MGNRGKKTLFLTALLLCCGMMLGAKSMMLGAKSVVQETERTEQEAKARQHVLVLAERGGQHEAFTQTGLQWLRQQADTLGFDMTMVADCHRLKAGDIGGYDLVVQLNYPPYAWNEAAAREFEQAVDSGTVAWVGFHHASLLGEFDGYQMWQWFSDFMGGIVYKNYIAQKCDGTVQVEDPTHPVMQGVATTFVIPDDEWYIYEQNPRRNVHVLAHVDEASYTTDTDIRMGDHPVVWTNTAKPARNVYFQFGHSALLWDNAAFLQLFENAIRWAAGTTTEHP